jgi:hypothetical protein
LNGEEGVDVNEVVPECDLVLVVGLVQIFIEHLNEGLFGVELALVVLGVDVDLVAQFFSFGDTHYLAPVSQQFLLVEVHYFVFALDLRSKDIFFHLCQLLQLVELLLRLCDLTDFYVLLGGQTAWTSAAALEGFA